MAAKRQINSLFEAVPSLAVILGLVLFEGRIAADPLLAWTTCLGMTGYLGALFLADRGARARGQDGGGGPVALRERAGEIGIIFAAQTVYVLGGMALDQLAAAQLPEGQNAVLAYANRLLMLGASLGATAVGRAVLPVLAEARLAGQDQRLTARWAGFLFLGGLAAWAIGHTIAPFGIRLLFEHGQFTADDTAAVARVLRIGLMILPAYFASLILSQSVVVQRRFGLLLASNLTAVGVKFLVLALFLDGGGLSAIMAANLAMQLTALLMLTSALRPVKRGKRRGDEPTFPK